MEEIVDLGSTESRRGNLKRRLLRIVVPIACVALMMASILGIALYSYSNNRRDALALSEDVLASLDRRIATEVRTFLSPASNLVKIVDRALAAPPPGVNRRDLAESLAAQMLKSIPQLAIFSFADTDGNYMMLKKMPDRSIHTKIIQRRETGIKVTWIRRDPDGREIGREYPTDDTYDPRTRPWYIGAVSTPGVFWTGVYIFFTDQKPGITAAKALRNDKGEVLGVIGLDIELTSLSAFLGSLQIGRSGRAMIIDETGRLVAYPEVARMMKEKGGELVALRLNELGDPVLDRAFNRFLIEKDGRRELSVQGITYINTFSSLQSAVDKRWSILIVVPSQDFVGFVSSNNRKALLMSIGVVILASLLAGLLIWQGLQADRSARLLLERRQEMETQSRAFSDLAARPAIFDPADIEALEHVTRITAEAIGVRRVSVWQWQLDGNVFFFGRDWQTAPADTLDAMRGRIGRVFSSGSWLEGFSLIENILMPQLHHTRRPIPELRQEAAQLAEQFSLPGLPLGQPEKYSRADLQRSACVRAFLGTPSLLLLEDPTFGVYPRIMTALVSAIRRARNRGAAVLWMTLSDDVWGDNSIPADRFFSVSGRKLTEVKRQT